MRRGIFIIVIILPVWLNGGVRGEGGLALEGRMGVTKENDLGFVEDSGSSDSGGWRQGPYRRAGRRDPFVPLSRDRIPNGLMPSLSHQAKIETEIPIVLGIVLGRDGYGAVLQQGNGNRILVEQGSELEGEQARVVQISGDTVLLEYRIEEKGKTWQFQRRISLPSSDTMSRLP